MKGIWIKDLPKSEMNVTVTFIHKRKINKGSEIKIAASNLYRIFINGELKGYGPARAAHGYSRVDKYSLEEYAGNDAVISVEVYSAQVPVYYFIMEDPFFACELSENGKTIATADDFDAYVTEERIRNVRRFAFQRPFTEIYSFRSDPSDFYMGNTGKRKKAVKISVPVNKLLERRVSYPLLQKTHPEFIEFGSVKTGSTPKEDINFCEPENELIGFRREDIKDDHIAYANKLEYLKEGTKFTGTILGHHYLMLDFGRNYSGFFSMKVKAKKGTTLFITYDEKCTETDTGIKLTPFRNNCANAIKYMFNSDDTDTYEHISFESSTCRFVCLAVTEGELELQDFCFIKYENPDPYSYDKKFSDSELGEIFEAAKNTLAQNSVDVLTDCPSRERAGWLCDSFMSAKAEKLLTGKNLVEYNYLENYAMAPHLEDLPDGMIPMCYPCDHKNGSYIPNWSMWYILELEDYLKRGGDRELVDRSLHNVKDLVGFFKQYENEFGLLENLEGWIFVDWSMCNTDDYVRGLNYPSNMLYADALRAASSLLGEPELLEKSKKIKDTVRKMSWNGKFFEDNAIRDENGNLVKTGHTTETVQYYAFYFGIATPETYPELWDMILNTFGPSRDFNTVYPEVHFANLLVGFYLRLSVLVYYGKYNLALADCKKLFLKMARMTGTFWEHWLPHSSLNHCFGSVVTVIIDECLKNLCPED